MSEQTKTQAQLLQEKLALKRKNLGQELPDSTIGEADAYCEQYKCFLDNAKTEREAVDTIEQMAKDKGFVLYEQGKQYQPGDRVYYINRRKAVILAVMGKRSLAEGVHIAAAHIDSPRLDLKPQPLYEDGEMALF